MVKKVTKTTTVSQKTTTAKPKTTKPKKTLSKPQTGYEIEQTLIDNFINLQKVLTNLSIKFDDLSSNMSKLLELFEISAKSFAEKTSEEISAESGAVSPELIKKIDTILEQNRTLSKGIMLVEEKLRERSTMQPSSFKSRPPQPGARPGIRPLPRQKWD